MKTLKLITSTLTAAVLVASTGAFAHEAGSSQEKITVLEEHPLLNAPGKKAMMLTVDYLPGQASIAHRHQGTAMAYVLEGEIISQVKGGPAITYKPGQSWYEPAGSEHLVSKNASNSKPAKLLVFMFMDEKDAVLIPLNQ
ncbi:cupin domain-containing protein [Pseudomonas gingeri]|uniref:Cupin domain-containing protein n=1 Tax=Pseudomonas gingeri TaxID=117681 RepID=A0A7Y8CKM5_9PSED|nr:cupin domain-containing protein [Pseudomonas gingeri]NVZ66496.1 cupin domain-containing protein [Pseudomonas gingeri]NVZ74585.1 cupin domain-containing protein [Pseudomonas gingeri]NVZ99342.1 cupin domain-containing protein [Pseudomonas gingeri]NWA13387.1 cupin domain-containing protein [Pseudomonas gingeri]NWA55648.1 cupin domain-containing protein [Pseudomonas gingeri]